MFHEGYIEAATSRARCKLRCVPPGHGWSEYWVFVALEINKEIVRDREDRPTPAESVTPIQYLLEDYPRNDCVTTAKLRENWFRHGGPVGVLP